jgi:ABC-type nickel/cobalt efflux system permease component RcnA
MPHKTPRSLNHSLRLGRLTAPQWAAAVVGLAALWVLSGFAARVADPNAHILAVALPTMLIVTPILVLWRGGVERYPAQLTRYAARQSVVYVAKGVRIAGDQAERGAHHAHARLQAARRRQG